MIVISCLHVAAFQALLASCMLTEAETTMTSEQPCITHVHMGYSLNSWYPPDNPYGLPLEIPYRTPPPRSLDYSTYANA